jgi:hypothetical protein
MRTYASANPRTAPRMTPTALGHATDENASEAMDE